MDFKGFWEAKHIENSRLWLTGSTLDEITQYHSITDFSDIMEIGVGTGSLRRELLERGLLGKYVGVDISEHALERVWGGYLTKDLRKAPKVKLAICHLVFQHCKPDEIKRIINDVPLKKGGIFSFQIAVGKKLDYHPLYPITLPKIRSIIKQTSKTLVSISDPFKHDMDWYIVKVK